MWIVIARNIRRNGDVTLTAWFFSQYGLKLMGT